MAVSTIAPPETKQQRLKRQLDTVRPRPYTDKWIWGLYLALVIVSLVELYSASSREIVAGNILDPLMRHAMLLFGGFVIMIILQKIHYRIFYKATYIIVAACIGATIYTKYFGLWINGARRAFSFFGICTVQPSELIKFSAALIIARLLCNYVVRYRPGFVAEDKRHNRRLVAIVATIVLIFGALLIQQGLTNTMLMMAISLSMMLICGVRWREYGMVLLVYGTLAGGYAIFKYGGLDEKLGLDKTEQVTGDPAERGVDRTNVHKKRMLDFLRPNKHLDSITSDNSQEQFSFIAQANGGVMGRFPGNSRETARLPLAFSDYIFAIIVEDMGMVGGIAVMFLYLSILARAGSIAWECKKAFPALLVLGMAVFITCQALMHIGIVVGVCPVSGQPLPLISKGGSSVVITSVALGMMLSVSRFAQRKGMKETANENVTTLSDHDMRDNITQMER